MKRQKIDQSFAKGFSRDTYLYRRRNTPISKRPIWKRKDGYLEVGLPENHWCYPITSKSRHSTLVHRLVMAEYLGRLLQPCEIVHHINGVRDDNRIENLKLTVKGEHELSYEDGYNVGLREGLKLRDNELEKQIKLLRWQVTELTQALQLKLGETK